MLTVGGRTFLNSGDARAAIYAARDAAAGPTAWPSMTYRTLGRTNFEASRLVMGCGASLMFREKDLLLNTAYDAGINVFDVGYSGYYRYAEENLSGFLKKVRDKIFLISKAPAELDVEPNDIVTVQQARDAAKLWSRRLDESLVELGVDHVNAYYLMASHNPSLIGSEEIYRTFQAAKQAGKVSHLGVSTHRNAENVLAAACKTGWYDLAMIAITPAGWYDWETKSVLEGSKTMSELQPVLEKARATGIALVGMKAARHLSGLPVLGWWKKLEAFDAHYDEKLLAAPLSPFQRSYAYVLAHGLDVVNADIQDLVQLQENVVATTSSPSYFA
jgi:aryl-alcohol dehydrogenase-like predicted oxidoreductase